jgi:hypothetical protein
MNPSTCLTNSLFIRKNLVTFYSIRDFVLAVNYLVSLTATAADSVVTRLQLEVFGRRAGLVAILYFYWSARNRRWLTHILHRHCGGTGMVDGCIAVVGVIHCAASLSLSDVKLSRLCVAWGSDCCANTKADAVPIVVDVSDDSDVPDSAVVRDCKKSGRATVGPLIDDVVRD